MVKTFVVLGMHRSATSLVAKGLSNEIFMGESLLGPNASNPHGHWEDRELVALNEAILESAGGRWDAPPPAAAIRAVEPAYRERIRALVGKRNSGHRLWGWKDPRTTLTASLFLPHLASPHLICCFRSPLEVARSLQRRDRMPLWRGLRLAEQYNGRLLELVRDFLRAESRNVRN